MRKIASLFVALLLLAGCSSVPLTGRKQVLLVSDQEVIIDPALPSTTII